MDPTKETERRNDKKINSRTSKRREKFVKGFGLLCVVIGLIIFSYPFFPYLKYKLFPPYQNYSGSSQVTLQEKKGLLSFLPLVGKKSNEEDKSGNRLIIPKIGVNVQIVEGQDDKVLLKGAWHLPNTASSGENGNMVITGHRFRFRPPNNTTFYLLDKLEKKDDLYVSWENKEYHYQVTEIKIVNPDDTGILAKTEKPTLTLFTCTPLFTTKQRLVVIGELIQ